VIIYTSILLLLCRWIFPIATHCSRLLPQDEASLLSSTMPHIVVVGLVQHSAADWVQDELSTKLLILIIVPVYPA
jgi:hypothetical protein